MPNDPPNAAPPAPDAPDASPGASPEPVAPIPCEVAVRRLWDYLDGGLAAPARAEVDAHLTTCAGCPPHFAFAGRLKGALAGTRAPSPDGPPADDGPRDAALRARVQAALRAAAGPRPRRG